MYRLTKLCDWADPNKLDMWFLARNLNPDAIAILAEKLEAGIINPMILRQRTLIETISISSLCESLASNPLSEAIYLLERILSTVMPLEDDNYFHYTDVIFRELAKNTNAAAIELLARYPEKIGRTYSLQNRLSRNTSPAAMNLLRRFPDWIDWPGLSRNPSSGAAALMVEYTDRVYIPGLLFNKNPEILGRLITAKHSLINCNEIAATPHIFEEVYDYAAMRAAMDPHREALARAAFHPRRLARHLEMGGASEEF